MATSKATTVKQYIDELPEDKRKVIKKVRSLIKPFLPKGLKEMMQWGMISYSVPLKDFPEGYGENPEVPLPFLSIAAQKNHFAVYLMSVYGDPKLEKLLKDEYKKAGVKLDMGKSCIRFKKLDNFVPEGVIAVLKKNSVDEHIKMYKKSREKIKKNQKKKKK